MTLKSVEAPTNGAGRPKTAILRVQGPDRNGIVAAFAQVLYGQ